MAVTILSLASTGVYSRVSLGHDLSMPSVLHVLFGDNWFQVRVQQRVIIRYPNPQASTAATKRNSNTSAANIKYKEEKIGKCLVMNKLVGSRPGGKDDLELITRDGQLIRAYLGDGCLAREFYAGAYVERSSDGKLCVDRDLLHARTGAKCEVEKFRLLTAKR